VLPELVAQGRGAGVDVDAPAAEDGQYVKADSPVFVRVTIRGEQWDGMVLGWRGERVYVQYRSPAGQHLAWVDAGAVERG
jgi:hypothetical protein